MDQKNQKNLKQIVKESMARGFGLALGVMAAWLLYSLIAFLLGSAVALAEENQTNNNKWSKFGLLETEYVGLEYGKIYYLRDPYMPEYTTNSGGEEWAYAAALLVDVNAIRIGNFRLFWNNRVHMDMTTDQVRHVGWYWEGGVTVIPKYVDFFHKHHSRHVLEGENETSRFPVRDEFTVRLHLIRK